MILNNPIICRRRVGVGCGVSVTLGRGWQPGPQTEGEEMTWNNKVTGPWRKASWFSGLDQHHSTSNMSIHHPTLPPRTQPRQLAAVVKKQFYNQQKVAFTLNLALPYQSIRGLGLTFIFLYLQPHIDFSPQERSITNKHEASRRDKSSKMSCQNSNISYQSI